MNRLIKKINESLKKPLALIMLASLLSISLISCRSVQEKIEAESWLVDSEDATLYRVVEENGEEYEEFIPIKGNKSSENFMCWHKDDIQKWAELLTKKCENSKKLIEETKWK